MKYVQYAALPTQPHVRPVPCVAAPAAASPSGYCEALPRIMVVNSIIMGI